jgi:hypothetical protein
MRADVLPASAGSTGRRAYARMGARCAAGGRAVDAGEQRLRQPADDGLCEFLREDLAA